MLSQGGQLCLAHTHEPAVPHTCPPARLPVPPAGFSFQVTPAKSGKASLHSFTPSKALLMGQETKMNMISPLASSSLFHTDIETGARVGAPRLLCLLSMRSAGASPTHPQPSPERPL